MENPIKMDDLGGFPHDFWVNTQMVSFREGRHCGPSLAWCVFVSTLRLLDLTKPTQFANLWASFGLGG